MGLLRKPRDHVNFSPKNGLVEVLFEVVCAVFCCRYVCFLLDAETGDVLGRNIEVDKCLSHGSHVEDELMPVLYCQSTHNKEGRDFADLIIGIGDVFGSEADSKDYQERLKFLHTLIGARLSAGAISDNQKIALRPLAAVNLG